METCFCGADAMLPCLRCDHTFCPEHGPAGVDDLCGQCEATYDRRVESGRHSGRGRAVGVGLIGGAVLVGILGIGLAIALGTKKIGYIIAPMVAGFVGARPLLMRRADRVAFCAERVAEPGGDTEGGDSWR